MKKHVVSPAVFSLASNLFGTNESTRTGLEKTIAIQNAVATDNRIKAIFPAIIEEAFAQTMDNYRAYIAAYNFKTCEENALIEKHNRAVEKHCNDNQLTEVQARFLPLFYKNNGSLSSRDFNLKADEFCNEYGLIVEKRKIQTVKYATEIIFANLLHLYNAQLLKRNTQYESLGIKTPRPIQEFKINSFLVTELKRNDVKSLDLCSKTVRNHRQRLQEAGVFVDYHFSGQNRPVEVHINAEILVVLDLKNPKSKNAENQPLTPDLGNVLPDNNESTGTLINEYQKKENVNNSLLIRSSSEALTSPYLFCTGTPPSKCEKSQTGGGEKNVKVSESLSDKLQNLIIHPQELAENLANHQYTTYKPIDIRHFYKEAASGTLTKEEFRELAIQDLFKTASKIWKHQTPFVGSWKKAINLYYQNKWILFTGNSHEKTHIAEEVQQMRWRIDWARKWFLKNDFSALFPYDYFDMTRKTSKEVGFEYTKQKWTEHLKAVANYDSVKKKQERDAIKRKETINHSKKMDMALKRFFKNKITLSQLFDYVENNLPGEFRLKLPNLIETMSLQLNAKTLAATDEKVKYSSYEF